MSDYKRRNVAPVIKATLRKINPAWKVSVSSDTGTTLGWIIITIDTGTKRPDSFDETGLMQWRESARNCESYITPKILQALKDSGERNRVYSYRDEMGNKHLDMSIDFL